MYISNLILSTLSIFTPAVGSGVPQAQSGWGATQPRGNFWPEVPLLRFPKIPLQASRPAWYKEVTQNCHQPSGETQKCQSPQKLWRKRRMEVGDNQWRERLKEREVRKEKSKARDFKTEVQSESL